MVQKPLARCKLVEPGSPEQRKLCAKPTREAKWAIEMQRQIRREAWAEAHHLKSLDKLRREEREAQRESAIMLDWFRVKRALRHTKNWSDLHTGIVKPHMLRVIPARAGRSPLPRYQIAIVDRAGRLFVFQRIRYYSALKTRPGHCAERAAYAIDGAYVEDGKAFIASSIGTTREEILEGTNVLEEVNRATSSNAKLAFHGIMQSCHLLTPQRQFDLASRYAEDKAKQWARVPCASTKGTRSKRSKPKRASPTSRLSARAGLGRVKFRNGNCCSLTRVGRG